MISAIPRTNYALQARLNRTKETKLVAVNANKSIYDSLDHLYKFFTKDDVIVINDSSVVPGSFQGYHYPSNLPVELRLVRFLGTVKNDYNHWEAIAYGEGNWRTATEDRLPPPSIQVGDSIMIHDLVVKIIKCTGPSKRLLTIEFEEGNDILLHKIYKYGKMIQYSYLQDELKLWDHQTLFSSYPVSIEPSSSVFQLNWDVIFNLQARGVKIIPITHAISISNTGIPEIDSNLPLTERYWLSSESADALNKSLDDNKNLIAFGTSVTRSLESIILHHNKFSPGTEKVDLVITKDFQLKVTKGILTGMHMSNESHINLLEAFLPLRKIEQEYYKAISKQFLWHEYGDSMLIKKF